MEEKVTIDKKEYDNLIKRSHWLLCLEGAGVDNWEGFDFAHDLMKKSYPEDYKY